MKRLNVAKHLAGVLLFLSVFCMMAVTSFAAEGKVIPKTANIRAQASADSEVVASTTQGKTIDIQGAVKDASGTVWYQVPISGGGHGYIRGDLVQTSDNIPVSEAQSAPAADSSSSGSPADTVPTAIGETQAVIKASQNVRVRSGASTQHSAIASLPNGTGVTLIGEANDNSGKKWYQITCNYNGRSVEGYVRADLVEVGAAGTGEGDGTTEGGEGEGGENPEGEMPEGEGGENPEGEASQPEAEPEHNDYQVVYAQNDTGEYEYYLYNNIEGNRQKLNELLSAVGVANENNQKLQERVDNGKIIIIVLAVVIVLLFIAVTVLIFKVRSLSYDYDYEEEEEYEDEEEEIEVEEEEVPARRRRRKTEEEDEEEEVPVKRKRAASSDSSRTGEKTARSKAKGDRELYAAEEAEPVRKTASRKPQNFLIDDDEFEFEFLNMDDKDL